MQKLQAGQSVAAANSSTGIKLGKSLVSSRKAKGFPEKDGYPLLVMTFPLLAQEMNTERMASADGGNVSQHVSTEQQDHD